MSVEGRGWVTRVGIDLVNWQQEEPAGFDGRRQLSLGGTSRMSREAHLRICERLGGAIPRGDSARAPQSLSPRIRSRKRRVDAVVRIEDAKAPAQFAHIGRRDFLNSVFVSALMPAEYIVALLVAERDRLTRAIEALQGPTKPRGRPPNHPTIRSRCYSSPSTEEEP